MGDAHYPSVRLGKVELANMHSYEKELVGDIEVYYLDRLPSNYKTIIVKTEKLFFFETLVAMGEK